MFSQLERLGAESTGDVSRQQGGAGGRVADVCHTKAKASLGWGPLGCPSQLLSLPVVAIIRGMSLAGIFVVAPTYIEDGQEARPVLGSGETKMTDGKAHGAWPVRWGEGYSR